MTIDIDALEALYVSGKFTFGSVPDTVLELIAELRQARAERDWAVKMVNSRLKFRICPTPERHEDCHKEPHDTLMPQETCRACWLKAAREAVEEKK